MFALSDADLARGPILGCADGPASFNAEAVARGVRVVSCDPLYQYSAQAIRARIEVTSAAVLEQTRLNAETFVWRDIKSVADLAHIRHSAMNTFLGDYVSGRRRRAYVAGHLPSLPFAGDTFAIAVCSHFLFLYSDLLDERFHVDAVLELCRVAGDVRIFPLRTLAAEPSELVERSARR
jgi:hypothetical protein